MGKLAYYLAHGQFENAGIAIEDEIELINKRIDDLIRSIVTDTDGKPAGGLQQKDIIETFVNNKRELGLFDHVEDDRIYAYWESNGEFDKRPSFVRKHEFKFKFRFPRKDC